ncbi:hypothetical protein HIMB100_00005130 [SAR116 cluster alpha proteobacterium HIMB100]|nr:hypothetical protein HIMB100_00005130 [SAR116 cluster alpha proteobacterium HIMB100]
MYNHNDIKYIMNNEYSVIRFTNDMSDEFNRWFIGLDGDELDKIGYQLSQLHHQFQNDDENGFTTVFRSPFEDSFSKEVNDRIYDYLDEIQSFYDSTKRNLTKDIFRTFGFDGEFENKTITQLKKVLSV